MSERDDLSAGLQIPDLELEPAVSKRPESVTARGSHSARLGSSPSGFADDDAFELVPTGAKLELSGDVIQPGPESQRATAAWPNGRTDSAEQLRVDPLEVTLVADYGVAPSSVALTPLYAYRVYARRRHLQRAVAEHHAALQRDEAERDEALAQLASELRPTLEANETFKRMLEPVRELERLAGDRNAALSQADAGYREQLAGFERELLGIGESLVEARKLLARCSDAAESTDADLRRAEGRNRRIQIEIRGVMDLARQALGPAGGDLPAPQAAQLANLQTRLHGLQPELDRTRAAHVGSSTELERARSELKRLEDKAHRVEREKAAAGGRFLALYSVRLVFETLQLAPCALELGAAANVGSACPVELGLQAVQARL